MLLLALVYALIALALITVVASASAVHLRRKQLMDVADGAAVDAADAVDAAGYFGSTGALVGGAASAGVPLTSASVRRSVSEYTDVRDAGGRFEDFAVDPATGSPDGRSAVVVLRATVHLPLMSLVLEPWRDGIPLTVTATARTRLPEPG